MYRPRLLDSLIEKNLSLLGGVYLRGPKWVGKTTSCLQHAHFAYKLLSRNDLLTVQGLYDVDPSLIFEHESPILFDEWQDAPTIWGTIRKYCDDHPLQKGQFILTGSSSNGVKTPHTGTLRISELEMLPLSLYESGESNGKVSLNRLFNGQSSFESCRSNLTVKGSINAICRGGWPEISTVEDETDQRAFAKEIFEKTAKSDISAIDQTKRSPRYAYAILRSLSRNSCTLANLSTVYEDEKAN